MITKIFLLAILLSSPGVGWGQSIWTSDITGTNPNASNPYTSGDIKDAGITVSGIGRGSGINGTNANNRYNANGWPSAFSSTAYFTFTLTPNSGKNIAFTSFEYTSQASATNAPNTFRVRCSLDGFMANLGAPSASGATIDLSDAAFQSITTAIEFRIYAFGGSSSSATYSVNDFTFNGTVTSTTAACTTPNPPTALTFSGTTPTSTTGSFTAPATAPSGYTIFRSSTMTAPALTDGTIYSSANAPSGYTFIGNQTGTSFNATGLAASTTYYFHVAAQNSGSCTGGPKYSTVLSNSVTTAAAAAAPSINITGNGNNINSGATTTNTGNNTDFGSTTANGGTISKTFTITNSGTAALTVGTISFSGPQASYFMVSTTPASSVAMGGGTTTFVITYTPPVTGNSAATVSIANNDATKNPYTFAISGTATCPAVADPVGTFSTMTNCGSTNISLTGTPPAGVLYYWQTTAMGTSTAQTTATPFVASMSGTYYVRAIQTATGCPSTNSLSQVVTVTNPVSITTQPASQTTFTGGSATFSVSATGSIAGYQWQENTGSGFTNITNTAPYSGATTASLTVSPVPLSYNGYSYRVIISGTAPCPDVTSNSATLTVSNAPFSAFDNFNRGTTNTVGIPSSGGTQSWVETESAPSTVTIDANTLFLSNTDAGGTSYSNAYEQASFDVSNLYATTYSSAGANLNWFFNFRSTRANPSGFGSNTYAMAFILGSDQANAKSSNASGYAVIIGNSSSPDPVKLVGFSGGLTSNSNVTDVAVSGETGETNYYSVHVVLNPCTNQWSLQVRNDGATSFADPTTINSSVATVTGTDATHVNKNLKNIICFFQHNNSTGENCRFDNISLPNNLAVTNTYVWNGATTDYQVPTNWTPTRTCPRPSDILQFNSSSPATATLTNVPTQTVGQILITNNRTVTYRDVAGDAASSQLSLSGSGGDDLVITAGSSLILNAASSDNTNDGVEINLLTGTTGNIAGTLTFQNTNVSAAGRPHRLLAEDANAITVATGGIVNAVRLSGSPFGTGGTANVVNFLSGSTYISGDGSTPFGLTQPASKITFQTGSLYQHAQASPPSLAGRTYADFEFAFNGTSSVLFGSTGALWTVDNLIVSQGTLNITGASNSQPINALVKGNLSVLSAATLNFAPTTASTFTIGGSNSQIISGTGTLILGANLNVIVNGTAPAPPQLAITRNINISGSLTLANGIVSTGSNFLILENGATVSGTSDASFVNGFVRKIGTNAFTFPVGEIGTGYVPIAISAPAAATDAFTAKYVHNSAKALGGISQPALKRVSNCDYWTLDRTAGSSNVNVTLFFNGNSACATPFVTDLPTLLVSHFNTSTMMWDASGNDGTTGTTTAGSVTWNNVSNFSPFALGSSSATQNPLPVSLISFTARKLDGHAAQIDWTANATGTHGNFELQKSEDAKTFEPIAQFASLQGANSYKHTDRDLTRTSWYRLRITDEAGKETFSNTEIVWTANAAANNLVSMAPNVVTGTANVNFNTATATTAQLTIVNAMGQRLMSQELNLTAGNSTQFLDAGDLASGNYMLHLVFQNGETTTVRFVKQ